jgi:hypothetical protein
MEAHGIGKDGNPSPRQGCPAGIASPADASLRIRRGAASAPPAVTVENVRELAAERGILPGRRWSRRRAGCAEMRERPPEARRMAGVGDDRAAKYLADHVDGESCARALTLIGA